MSILTATALTLGIFFIPPWQYHRGPPDDRAPRNHLRQLLIVAEMEAPKANSCHLVEAYLSAAHEVFQGRSRGEQETFLIDWFTLQAALHSKLCALSKEKG